MTSTAEPKAEVAIDASISFQSNSNDEQNYNEPEIITEEHLDAIKKQIEYYFSKENLQNDAFLASQMDANKSVSIAVIMKFAKLKALTQDENVIRQSLKSSNVVTLVDDRIRANIKAVGRSTIILREIPNDTNEEEIKQIFDFDGCKPIISMRSDIENTWFVVMESEDDAKDTVLQLKLKRRLFRGEPVKARLKTETFVRSFYPLQPVVPMPPVMYPPGMQFPGFPGPLPYGYMPPVVMPMDPLYGSIPMPDGMILEGVESEPSPVNKHSPDRKNATQNGFHTQKHVPNGSRDNRKAGGSRRDREGQNQTQGNRRGRNDNRNSNPSNTNSNNIIDNNKEKPSIEINAINFPPLHHDDDVVHVINNIKNTVIAQNESSQSSYQELLHTQSNIKIIDHQNQGRINKHSTNTDNDYQDSEDIKQNVSESKKPGTWAALLKSDNKPTTKVITKSLSSSSLSEKSNNKEKETSNRNNSNGVVSNVTSHSNNKDIDIEKSFNIPIDSKPNVSNDFIEHEVDEIIPAVKIEENVVVAEPAAPVAATTAPKTNSWGGKPTFANILKQADASPSTEAVTAVKAAEKTDDAGSLEAGGSNEDNDNRKSRTPNKADRKPSKHHSKSNRNNKTESGRSEADNWRRPIV